MQCGTMLVKNLIGRLGVHDKTNHTLVWSLSLDKIIGRPIRVTIFCENVPIMWDWRRLKGTLKSGIFTPKA